MAILLVAAAPALVAASCGGSDESSSSTTAKASTSTSAKEASTSTTQAGTRNGSVEVRIGDTTVSATVEKCSNRNTTSLDLTASDSAGNTLTVKATDGSGSVTYRGGSEDREGTVRSVQVESDGTFSVSGVLSTADDSAPAPDDLSISGLCP